MVSAAAPFASSFWSAEASSDCTGFAAWTASSEGNAAVLTRPIRFTAPRKYLFMNAIGRVSVSVQDNQTDSVLHGLEGGLSCVSPLRGTALDSTKAAVGWGHGASCAPADLSALEGREFRLRFQLAPGARLFAFWLSAWSTGESDGFVAAGGPGFAGPRDAR